MLGGAATQSDTHYAHTRNPARPLPPTRPHPPPPAPQRGDLVEGVVMDRRTDVPTWRIALDIGNDITMRIDTMDFTRATDPVRALDRRDAANAALPPGKRVRAVVLAAGGSGGGLSTAALEREPGEMLRDPQRVFEEAAERAEAWRASDRRAWGMLEALQESEKKVEVAVQRVFQADKSKPLLRVHWDSGLEFLGPVEGTIPGERSRLGRVSGEFRGGGGRGGGGGGTSTLQHNRCNHDNRMPDARRNCTAAVSHAALGLPAPPSSTHRSTSRSVAAT
jgi:hypothetical protein